jgi:hypothetical protein
VVVTEGNGSYAYSPPREEGVAAIAAGVVAQTLRFGVIDHPVCGDNVGLRRNFLDAAAIPPREEGNAHNLTAHQFVYLRLKTIREHS